MNPDEKEQMELLCVRIATEQDQQKFIQLVKELNDLLEGRRLRFPVEENSK